MYFSAFIFWLQQYMRQQFQIVIDNKPDEWFDDEILRYVSDRPPIPEDIKKVNDTGCLNLFVENISKVISIDPTLIDRLKNYTVLELVNKKDAQRVAFKVLPVDADCAKEIYDRFVDYINTLGHNSPIIFTKVGKEYEIIAPYLLVKDASYRSNFIGEFRRGIGNKLSEYISQNESWSEDTEYTYWKSIQISTAPIEHRAVGIVTDCDEYHYIDVADEKPENRFVNYIINEKPDWYKVGEWIDITTFHGYYLLFDKVTSERYFPTRVKNMLWTEKKQINRKMCYKLENPIPPSS